MASNNTSHTVMTSVHKYQLSDRLNRTVVNMPAGAQILRLALQKEVPTIWARVDPDASRVERTFEIFGTGRSIPTGANYIGTFDAGPFVWHVFELLPDELVPGEQK
jgi:hypothetical protein